jgi:hypothetical protein
LEDQIKLRKQFKEDSDSARASYEDCKARYRRDWWFASDSQAEAACDGEQKHLLVIEAKRTVYEHDCP